MTVSVCIPAYRAGRFLRATLQSVVNQSYQDLQIHVSVDPSDSDGTGRPDDTYAALTPFLKDRRFVVHRNPIRLGWDGNIRSLLRRVETDYYVILPHDDIWHPHYIDILLRALKGQPSASVAYGDFYSFGVPNPFRRAVRIPYSREFAEQVFSFFLEGAHSMPWRGLTRSAVLSVIDGFPIQRYRGPAVDCEYALSLLLAGPVLHVPRVLYYKRYHPKSMMSATREKRVYLNVSERIQAWKEHSLRMLRLLEEGIPALRDADKERDNAYKMILGAYNVAMLKRYQVSVRHRLDSQEFEQARRWLATMSTTKTDGASAVKAKLHLVFWRHATAMGESLTSTLHAEAAFACCPADSEACLALATDFESRGKLIESLELISQAEQIFPGGSGQTTLRQKIYKRLGWLQHPSDNLSPNRKELSRTEAFYRRVYEQDKDNFKTLYALCRFLRKNGKLHEVLELLSGIREDSYSGKELCKLCLLNADIHKDMGNSTQAGIFYQKAFEKDRMNFQAVLAWCRVLRNAGNHQAALGILAEVDETRYTDKQLSRLYLLRANLNADAGNVSEAETCCRKACDSDHENLRARRLMSRFRKSPHPRVRKAGKIVIFGAGRGGLQAMRHLDRMKDKEIICFADNDPKKQGTEFQGKRIIGPGEILSHAPDMVIIASMYADEIYPQLRKLGLNDERIAVYESDPDRIVPIFSGRGKHSDSE